VVPAYYESDFNWKLYTKLKAQLEEYGIEVVSTRENQKVEMGTKTRGRFAKDCDAFFSLHANWAERESADHVVIYEMLDKKKHDLAVALATTISKTMGTKEAYDIRTKAKDSGGEWYGVLQGCAQVSNNAGFILEHSFYSNKAMATWMMNDDNIGKLAEVEAATIAKYFGVNKPQPAAPSVEFHVNDIVSIKDGAVYTTGAKIPSWVRKKAWIIKSISGNVAIIDKAADGSNSINSPVDVKYLELVQPAKIEQPKPQPEPKPEPVPEVKEPVIEAPIEPTPEPAPVEPEPAPEPAPVEPEVETPPVEETQPAPEPQPETPPVAEEKVEVKEEEPQKEILTDTTMSILTRALKFIIDFIVSLFKKK
jgi:hypothetical protein